MIEDADPVREREKSVRRRREPRGARRARGFFDANGFRKTPRDEKEATSTVPFLKCSPALVCFFSFTLYSDGTEETENDSFGKK